MAQDNSLNWIQLGALKALRYNSQTLSTLSVDAKQQQDSKKGSHDTSLHVVLFHGYGANAEDLAGLGLSSSLEDVTWVFPEAPLVLPFGEEARSWFHFSLDEWKEFHELRGNKNALKDYLPEGFEEQCSQILKFIESLEVDPSRLILGGFSQGSFLAVEVLARMREKAQGLAVLSGSLFNEQGLRAKLPSCRGVPFFQSHGFSDNILPYGLAQELEQVFKSAGMKGELLSFHGGHEIPPLIFHQLEKFIRAAQREDKGN